MTCKGVVIGGEFSKEEAPFALNREGGPLSALGVTRDYPFSFGHLKYFSRSSLKFSRGISWV